MTLGIEHYLTVSAILFSLGLWVALSKRNAIAVLMGVELMFNAVNIALVAFARFGASPQPIVGHTFALFVIAAAAAEAAVALALTVAIYRLRTTVDVERIDLMRF
jgi:NADH:ubiquinone oxidoreductase subunit K